MARKVTVLCQLSHPLLNPIEASEIRSEIRAMKPAVHLVLPDWGYLEVRGLTEADAPKLIQMLRDRQVNFRLLSTSAKSRRPQVQVAVDTRGE